MDYYNHTNQNHELAVLESRIDHLETEFSYLNQLLIDCGFEEGIRTLKVSAEEMLKNPTEL